MYHMDNAPVPASIHLHNNNINTTAIPRNHHRYDLESNNTKDQLQTVYSRYPHHQYQHDSDSQPDACHRIYDASRPRLRKKPKLTLTSTSTFTASVPCPCKNIEPSDTSHMHKLAAISKTSSFPSLRFTSDGNPSNNRPSSPGESTQIASPLQRTHSHPLHRSPSQKQKKPPASHSSYGVETFCGPPPSYSTQRTLSQDKLRSLDRNPGSRITNNNTRDLSPTKPNESAEFEICAGRISPVKRVDIPPTQTDSSEGESSPHDTGLSSGDSRSLLTPDSSMTKPSLIAADAVDSEQHAKSNPQMLKPGAGDDDGKGSSSDERKSEDLFLNIARTDAGQSSYKPDKRRSRISLPFLSTARPFTGYKSSPTQQHFDTASLSGRSDALRYYSKRASMGQHIPGSLTRGYSDGTTMREDCQDAPSQIGTDLPRRALSRRYSNTNTESARPRTSTARASRLATESVYPDRSKTTEHNATESTTSTTAPSTVWDELDDLKSRIKKLELTGKLPPSSAAAMTSSERPRTATTAATTMSSSPKHKPNNAQLQSAIEGIPSTVHPLLHEALSNAKASLSNEVYQKLQATAQDALQLSMMLNPEGHAGTGSTIGGFPLSERQVRRRTESMCRSLTELAIAILADPKPAVSATRPGSRDAYQPLTTGLRSRRYSNEQSNDRPPITSRVQSRLESRRTSVPYTDSPTTQQSAENQYHTPPTALPQLQPNSSSRTGRTSTLMHSRRTAGYLDGTTDDEQNSPSVRPVSRAMTEVSTYRQMAKDRASYSREYTAQHPMPSPIENSATTRSAMPANLSTNLVSRRKYASPGSVVGYQEQTLGTAKEPWGRITIVPATASSPIISTPDSPVSLRPSNSRRSLGFASRISSVSSRLRAAKAERNGSVLEAREGQEMAQSNQQQQQYEYEKPLLDRQGSGQSVES